VFSSTKVLGKNTTRMGGDFFSNLHDLGEALITRSYLCSWNGTKTAYWHLNKKNQGGRNENGIGNGPCD